MKRFINSKNIPLLVLGSSLLAMLLRIWTRGGGPDAGGLFAPKPLVWCLLWLLTFATAAAIVMAVGRLKNSPVYREHYPKSVVAGLCAAPAGVYILISSYLQLRSSVALELPETTIVDTVAGLGGLVAGLCLLLAALHRCMGRKPFFLINGLICLYLALRLFNRCQIWSNETQTGELLIPFLASVTLMLAFYQRTCFDVDMGKRPKCLLLMLLPPLRLLPALSSWVCPAL